jgi:predicted  nucleic acid-binding Zn ribbon protein
LHIIKLHITGNNVGSEEFFESAEFYFQSLYSTNQIVNEERQYESIQNGLSVNLFCPEKDSFKIENSAKYANQWRAKLETELECIFEFKYIGLDPEYEEYSIPESSSFYILKVGEFSPVLDGDTFETIPLYKIPFTYEKTSYYNINSWERNFIRVNGLWFNGTINESWMQDQLERHDSELNNQGFKCAKKIEELTKLPTYYYLFNYREGGEKKDKLTKCPGCGGDWLIEGKTPDDLYGFKCDPCRFVSELSSNSE